ncbi:septal ring lytic transglycosylase RlpA family protein [Ferrimonas lipolytica]|uniref:Endolytic peptidoglycan transglycosylase RlpA n=1 Tax=Ferrimonas lipolytica TaxID=2724191 RepID=A0A6H1UG62_9GAMM|nr:septal ring lytic transglycosylase RlpA family protein [Ferrimonas lipolytica]QIZ77590.1 septal ring lytic transglycosylase RlpA family protein [Ferrimonas lipolytica]
MRYQWIALIVVTLLAGCAGSGSNNSRYQISQDHAPTEAPDLSHLEPPAPRYEAMSPGGNRNYTVLGKDYKVLASAEGFVKEGTASWYGKKFHGHLTSNGETYDMYGFSAAHKSLPLPTYAKVTNLANGKHVVVRVNDRGPFHGDREIDLSYAAAYKLDVLKHGTAQVRIEALTFPKPGTEAEIQPEPTTANSGGHYVQLAASSQKSNLDQLGAKISKQYSVPSRVTQQGSLYKLQLGPFDTVARTQELLNLLQAAGFSSAFKILDSDATD